MDFLFHLQRMIRFSRETFGPNPRQQGVIDHIRKELVEIEKAGTGDEALKEWIDVIILGIDGAWRSQIGRGLSDEKIVIAIVSELIAKQMKNEQRTWPDWRKVPEDKAIEHDRSKDVA